MKGITKRFDENWNEVERPRNYEHFENYTVGKLDAQSDEYYKNCYAYSRAKEYQVLVGLSEFVDRYSYKLQPLGDDEFGRLGFETLNVQQVLIEPPQLSDFVPAVLEDGKWEVLKKPEPLGYHEDQDEYEWDEKQVLKYNQALSQVKYEGWSVFHYVDSFIGVRFSFDYSIVYHPSGMTSFNFNNNLAPVKFKTTEELINELKKHNQYLILK